MVTERYGGAARNLRFYLLAAPDAPDAKQAKTLMYELEYEQEKVDRANAQVRARPSALLRPSGFRVHRSEAGEP